MFAARTFRSLLACVVLACLPLASMATMVRVATPLGPIDIELFDTAAPATVANFLGYVRSGAYNSSFFHRHAQILDSAGKFVSEFVIQGGGYTWGEGAASQPVKIPAGPPVKNEFSATRSNLRGTVAMAKIGVDVGGVKAADSATTEWFVNLANNAANLDNQNGGFTVFGRVTAPGMAIMDAIATLRILKCASPFDALPVLGPVTCATATRGDAVIASVASAMPAVQSDSDRIFNYLEAAYPQYAAPASAASATAAGYYYRYYTKTVAYAGTKDGNIYYLVPALGPDVVLIGSVAQWLAIAAAAGY